MQDQAIRTDLEPLAREWGIDLTVLMAVVEVESGGRIFALVDGRREPLIRFEGHYFYRLLGRHRRNIAVTHRLAHPRAGHVHNPRSQAQRWKLLRRAMAVDRGAALQSVSWGVGQVMGVHWRWLDYASIDHLVARARDGVCGQAELMLRFIDKAGLKPALSARDWRAFARVYNGPGFARHRYDQKLEAAYQRYAASKAEPGRSRPLRHAPVLIRFGDHGELVRGLQARLCEHGYRIGIDGDFGPLTDAALRRFQADHGLAVDGIAGPETFRALERPVRGACLSALA